jgi:general stress protein YciG
LEPQTRELELEVSPIHNIVLGIHLTTSAEFAQGKVDPVEAGKQGGQTGGNAGGSASGAGGSAKGGKHTILEKYRTTATLMKKPEFAHGKVDPHEAGKKGGNS